MRRHLPRVVLLAVAILAWPAAGGPPARAAAYDGFYANFAGEELMRAVNADRTSLGLAPLATDSTLASIARDRALACPSNGRLTIRGRARDMADRGYLGHTIPGCTDSSGGAFDTFDLLKAFGYTYAGAAENIGDNNYPASATTYATGCGLGGGGCRGSTTLPRTVAVVERSFMSSSQHRTNLLSSSYGRFGCGAWASASGYRYFACYFISSGNGTLDGTGPAIGQKSGVGVTFAAGSRPTFTASASDSHSVLSDGWAAIDGVHIRDWAWDHAGSTSSLSATAPALKSGSHTFTWWVRDASTNATTASFQFSVSSSGGGGGGGGLTPTPTPRSVSTPRPSPRPTARVSAAPGPTPSLEAPASSQPSTTPATTAGGFTGGSVIASPRTPTGDASDAAASSSPSPFVILVILMVGWTTVVIAFGSTRLRRAVGGALSRSVGGGDRTPR